MFGIYEICSHNHPNDKDNKHYFYYEFHIVKLQKLSLKFKKNKRERKAYKIDRSNNNFKMYAPINKLKFTKVDLRNFSHFKKSLSKIKPDLIFHLASNADVRGSFNHPLEHVKNNNIITANLLEALRELKLKPLIIICSTSEVYGNVKKKQMPIKEEQQIAPINPYAVTKTFQDLLSQVYSKAYNFIGERWKFN